MATDIASLAIKLTGDATSFESSLIAAERRAMSFCDSSNSLFTKFGANAAKAFDALTANPLFAGLVVGAGIVEGYMALDALSRKGEKAAMSQEALERKLGITAQAAGGMAYAFGRFGIDTDDATKSLAAFSVHLGDAALKGGEAAAAYTRLGLDAQELTTVPMDVALGRIGDALSQVTNRSERMSLAQHVLTRRGTALLPVLMQGTEGMARMAKESERLGLTFTAADSAMVRRAHLAETRASQVSASFSQSFGNAFAVADAPLREFMANAQSNMMANMQDSLRDMRENIRWMGREGWPAFFQGLEAGWAVNTPRIQAMEEEQRRLAALPQGSGHDAAAANRLNTTGDMLGAVGGFLADNLAGLGQRVHATLVAMADAPAAAYRLGYNFHDTHFVEPQLRAAPDNALIESTLQTMLDVRWEAERTGESLSQVASRFLAEERFNARRPLSIGGDVATAEETADMHAAAMSDHLAEGGAAGSKEAQDAISRAIVEATGGDVQEQIRDNLAQQGLDQAEMLRVLRDMRDLAVNGGRQPQLGAFGQG